jgi:competence protein ComEC
VIKYSLAFLAGNVLIHQFSQLNTGLFLQLFYTMIALVIVLFILGYFSKSYQHKKYFYTALITCLFFSVSFFSSYFYVKNSLAQVLPEQIEAKEIIVQAYIDSIPIENNRSIKFNLKLKKVLSPDIDYSDKIVRVSWYTFSYNKSRLIKDPQQNKFKVGDLWQFKLKLKRPSGLLNPGTMDYEKVAICS